MPGKQTQLNQVQQKTALLRELERLPAGDLPPELNARVFSYIADNWQVLDKGRDQTSMGPGKLWRAEDVTFTPPATVSFRIERHGGTVCGSKYAELHVWECDLLNDDLHGGSGGKRLLYPLDKRLDVKPLARAVMKRILDHDTKTRLLKWKADDDVRIAISELIPATNKETTSSRRKRFRNEICALLEPHGWTETMVNRFRHTSPGQAPKL